MKNWLLRRSPCFKRRDRSAYDSLGRQRNFSGGCRGRVFSFSQFSCLR
jgi:hypothetical protein